MNKISKILIVIIFMCTQSCTSDNNVVDFNNYQPKIIIEDNALAKYGFLNWQSTGLYEPLYVGKPNKSLTANKEYKSEIEEFLSSTGSVHWREKKLKNFGKTNIYLELKIDTTKKIVRENFMVDMESEYGNSAYKENNYYSYPVYIHNNDSDTLTIGWGDLIPLTKQALDSLGEWKTIETAFQHMCGTGLMAFNLAPNEIVMTSTIIYKGDYKTKVRLNYNGLYSNEIEEEINYNQFNSIFDENGEHKKDYLIEKEKYDKKIQ